MVYFSKTSVEFVHSQKAELGCELVGSWTVSVGDMDQALHLWRYVGGFEKIDKAKIMFKENAVRYYFDGKIFTISTSGNKKILIKN